MGENIEKLMEKLKDTAKQNIKDNSININTPQIKKKT
jgi:hypothetical protein